MVVKTVRSCFGCFFLSAIPLPRSNFRPPFFSSDGLPPPLSFPFVPPYPLLCWLPSQPPSQKKRGKRIWSLQTRDFFCFHSPPSSLCSSPFGKELEEESKKCNSLSCCLLFRQRERKTVPLSDKGKADWEREGREGPAGDSQQQCFPLFFLFLAFPFSPFLFRPLCCIV